MEAGGCYGSDLQGFWGWAQGDPLSPTISNVVLDAVVRHWVEVMAWAEDYSDCISYVGIYTHPVEQREQGAERPL